MLAVVSTALYRRECNRVVQQQREREAVRIGMFTHFVRTDLLPVLNHARVLADGEGLRAFLQSGKPSDLERAVRRAVFFSRLQPDYDEIQYINEAGRETLRVIRGGEVVAPDQLEDLADQRYFQKASELSPEQIYISAFELATVRGKVVQPFKPVLRFATPVIDATGRHRGVYVITVLGDNLLKRLLAAAPLAAHRLRMLNARGYWIRAAQPEQEWGFVLPERSQSTLAKTDPALWAKINGAPTGQTTAGDGIFTWARINPEQFARDDPDPGKRIVHEDDFLVIATEVSGNELAALVKGPREIFLIVVPIVLALLGSTAWFLRSRQRAAQKLRRSEESLAVTLQSIGDAVMATDPAGRVTQMNGVAEHLTGWTIATALGRPIGEVFQIINEETRQPAAIPIDDVLATGRIHGLANHTILIASDGTERSIADSAAPIRDRGGLIHGVVLVFRDVTAEREAERKMSALLEELACERSRLKFIFESLPIGISFASTAPDGRRTRLINDAHLAICGITREQADEPDRFIRITHPDDREPQARHRERLDAGEIDRFTIDKRYVHNDGQIVWAYLSFQRRRLASGGTEDLSFVLDITARKQAEEERERFFTISLDLLCIASGDGYFKRVSSAVTDILGWSVEEFLATPYMHLVHPDDRPATRGEVERQIHRGEKVLHFENRYRHKDGSWRVLAWRSAPHPGELMYATARDVTELKRTQAQIEQLNQELHQRAAALEAANKELEAFSYSVSHDLRAPLRHVHGYVELLTREAQTQLSDKAARYLKTIADASREMGELIDDLLSFSHMGRVEMSNTVVDLDQLVGAVRRSLEPRTEGRVIEWNIAPLPLVHGDAAMLRQVWTNLLDNAVKYTHTRDAAVIEIGCAGADGDRAVFYVRDNGAGFDMKYATKLFGVFQRLHTTEEFEGTGIGLANVRRIINRHEGRTWAESQVDVGSTFYFTLRPAGPLPAAVIASPS